MEIELLVVAVLGFFVGWLAHRWQTGSPKELLTDLLRQAEEESRKRREREDREQRERRSTWEGEQRERIARVGKNAVKAKERLFRIDRLQDRLKQQAAQLAEGRRELLAREEALELREEQLANTTAAEAREEVLSRAREELARDLYMQEKRAFAELEEQVELRSQRLVVEALARVPLTEMVESGVVVVELPNEGCKGKIIGREGRNVRLFEQLTGVNLVVGDAPCTISLSSFHPERREVARMALESLIRDQKIFPAKIQQAVEVATRVLPKQLEELGREAAEGVGAFSMDSHLHRLLGQLSLRSSLGQNLLAHSVEVASLMGMMATELELDGCRAVRIGLLHDIGKAESQDCRLLGHASVGGHLAKKYGEATEVVLGIAAHHGDKEPGSLEGALCSIADALSAARPGARSGRPDVLLRRIQKMEQLAKSFPGVKEAWGMQAGRELHVLVCPESVADHELSPHALAIANRLEKETDFPYRVRVLLVRTRETSHYTRGERE